ncbi:MAG TPA: ABC transporter permease [Terriglobia bacterium]|nr:ABC transporter permease [Terriglobia bacterium]
MTALRHDILYGIRLLLNKPGFTLIAALSLGLGIGANTTIFSLINTTLLRPLAFPNPDRLVAIWTVPAQNRNQRNVVNLPSYTAWRQQNRSFDSIGGFFGASVNAGAGEQGTTAEKLNGQYFSDSMFETLGAKPAVGRLYTAEESKIGAPTAVIVISHALWQRRFAGDANVLGKTITMDGVTHTIIGVMRPGFNFFRDDADFWSPSGFSRERAESAAGLVLVVGRLKPNVAIKEAQSEMDALASQLAASDPNRNKGMGALVQPLQEAMFGRLQGPLLTLQGAVAFVLLIGCANVAGMFLARGASRKTEVAIRSAIGAGRWRIARQLLTESVLLAALGGVLGVFLAWGGLRLFVASAPPGFPRLRELSLDLQVLGFTALTAILTGLLFGMIPAIQASRTNLVDALKDSSRSASSGVGRHRLRSGLVTIQIGLALVLLIGAGLMINSFMRINNSQPGIDPHGLLTFNFSFPVAEVMKRVAIYKGVGLWEISANMPLTYDRVLERLKTLPGVQSAAGASRRPLQGAFGMDFLIEGRPAPPAGNAGTPGQNAGYLSVTSNYFATLKIPILRGRDFDERDTAANTAVVIINQSMAKRFWPNEDPIGRHITFDFLPDDRPREIVAIVGDTRLNRTQREPGPIMYVPHGQEMRWRGPSLGERSGMFFVLRTVGDPMSLLPAVRKAVAEVDPTKPVAFVQTVEQTMDQQVQYVRLYVLLLGVFGAIAAVLAAVGIYGVMASSVAQRKHEIGIRMALGASSAQVLTMVVRQALILIAIGLVLGLAGSFALTRIIASALWGVTATDPATFAGVSLFLVLVALIACFIPTRQAARVDPASALRSD